MKEGIKSEVFSFTVLESEYHLKSMLQTARLFQKPRIKMLLLLVRGVISTTELAKRTKCNRDSIRNWKKIYLERGIEGLYADERGGKTFGAISDENKAIIKKKLAHPATSFASYKALAEWINQRFDLNLSYSNLNAYIKRHFSDKFKPRKKKKLSPAHQKKKAKKAV